MIAFPGYVILECEGLWQSPETTTKQSVIVKYGSHTLTFLSSDGTGTVLRHWSLDTIIEQPPSEYYYCFSPDSSGNEFILINDDLMVNAIRDLVQVEGQAVEKPRGNFWKFFGKFIAFVLVMVAITYYFSDYIGQNIARAIVGPKRAEIGETIYANILELGNSECLVDDTIADKFENRLFPETNYEIRLVSGGIPSATVLPGGIVVINGAQFNLYDDKPEVFAGYLLLANERNRIKDSLIDFMETAGLLTSLRLLLGREISPFIYQEFATELAKPSTIYVPEDILYRKFLEKGIPPEPFSIFLLSEGMAPELFADENTLLDGITQQLLEDTEWIELQNSCN